jgi:hypothetical protein
MKRKNRHRKVWETHMRRHLPWLLAFSLGLVAAFGQDAAIFLKQTSTSKQLTDLLCAVTAGNAEPDGLQAQIRTYLASPQVEETLRWLSHHSRFFSRGELNAFHAEFIRLNPQHEWTPSTKENLAREIFRERPRDERLAVYRSVIGRPGTQIQEGFPINRGVALSMAAWEGLTELESEIIAHGSEIAPTTTAPLVPYTLWILRLAKGAENYRDALALRARNLAEMPDREFFELMKTDTIFAQFVQETAMHDCSPSDSMAKDREVAKAFDIACNYFQGIVSRQETYTRQRGLGREAIGGIREAGLGSCMALPTSWLERLAYVAKASRYSVRPACASPPSSR